MTGVPNPHVVFVRGGVVVTRFQAALSGFFSIFLAQSAEIGGGSALSFGKGGFLAPMKNFSRADSLNDPVEQNRRLSAVHQDIRDKVARREPRVWRAFGFLGGRNQLRSPLDAQKTRFLKRVSYWIRVF